MKKLTKLLIKFSLLFMLFMVIGCQKEDNPMVLDRTINLNWDYSLGGKTLLTINAQDIPKILQTIADQRKGYFPNLEPNTNGRDLDVNNPFGIVDESNIMALEDQYGYRTYTFKISPYNSTENIFFNLIVTADADGSVINSYIKKYESFNGENPGPTFDGKNSKYELDGTIIHDVTFTQGRGVAPDCEPCIDPDDNSDPGDNNNGGTDDGDINDPSDDNTDDSDGSGGGGYNNSGDPGDSGNPSDGSDTGTDGNDGTNGDGGNGGNGDGDGPCGGGVQYYPDCTKNYVEYIEVDGVLYEVTVDCCRTPIVSRSTNNNSLESRTEEIPLPCCDEDVVVINDDDSDDDCNTSKEDLKKVFPNISDTDASTLASVINDKGEDFGIDSKEKLQHFLSQAGHEVGGFNNGFGVEESTSYSTKSRLLKIFGKYYSETDTINKRKPDSYISNPSGHANYVYCCRMGNGNESSGDGYKYRGRGIFQLTGKTNYNNFQTWYNDKYDPDKDFVATPSLLKSNDTIAILSALWYYKTSVLDKITIDSTTTVKQVTKKVNGGTNGLSDRKEIFTKAKDSIDCN